MSEAVYRVAYKETGEVQFWTLKQILAEINSDRSEGWSDYDETDWQEGWSEWMNDWAIDFVPIRNFKGE